MLAAAGQKFCQRRPESRVLGVPIFFLRGFTMPRGRPKKQPSIAELQEMLRDQRGQRAKLLVERKNVAARLDQIDRQIGMLDGEMGVTGGSGSGRRAHNALSLPDAIHAVLKKNGKPMKVGDITASVQTAGYQSTSANFRGIVNQALIKDSRFIQDGRGVYKSK